jgi:hypothetical protein
VESQRSWARLRRAIGPRPAAERAKRPSKDSGAEPSGNQDERNGEAHRNRCSWLRSPKEDLDLTHPTGHGLNRGVGQLPPSAPQIHSTGR